MSGYWEAPNDYSLPFDSGQGSAHSVSSTPPDDDPAEEVRRVVEEVTRKQVPRPLPPRIGF